MSARAKADAAYAALQDATADYCAAGGATAWDALEAAARAFHVARALEGCEVQA